MRSCTRGSSTAAPASMSSMSGGPNACHCSPMRWASALLQPDIRRLLSSMCGVTSSPYRCTSSASYRACLSASKFSNSSSGRTVSPPSNCLMVACTVAASRS